MDMERGSYKEPWWIVSEVVVWGGTQEQFCWRHRCRRNKVGFGSCFLRTSKCGSKSSKGRLSKTVGSPGFSFAHGGGSTRIVLESGVSLDWLKDKRVLHGHIVDLGLRNLLTFRRLRGACRE